MTLKPSLSIGILPYMDDAKQIDKDRFFSMASAYDRLCREMVPAYDFMHHELIRLLRFFGVGSKLVVDLGAGSGILLERILDEIPASTGVWIDYSDDFQRIASRKLARFGERVSMHRASFTDEWEQLLPTPPAVIVSMSAIHHLEDKNKKSLYRRCFDALAPGGWFFNIDEMKTMDDTAYRTALQLWISHVDETARKLASVCPDELDVWMAKFDSWKQRNVTNMGTPKTEGDDIHASFLEQIDMLGDVGFEHVDLFAKLHLWSMIGGRKPLQP